jgi:hypothetical protein
MKRMNNMKVKKDWFSPAFPILLIALILSKKWFPSVSFMSFIPFLFSCLAPSLHPDQN